MRKILISLLLLTAAAPTTKRARHEDPPFTGGIIYKRAGGKDLHMLQQFPSGWKATDQRAAVVLFFGGGWTQRWSSLYDDYADHLVNDGLVVLRPDYRLGKVEDCVEDAKSAIRYARQHASKLGVDPSRIIAGGGSAGGHLGAAVATIPGFEAPDEDPAISSRPNLVMVLCPVMDLTHGNLMTKEQAAAVSPVFHLDSKPPATLIMVAADDSLVKTCREYAAAATAAGLECDLKIAPTGGHGFFIDPGPGQDAAFRWSDDFLREHHCLNE